MYRLLRYAQPFAPSAHRSPWTGLDQEINSLFTSALAEGATRSIPVGLREDKDNLLVTAELPGVARDDINIELTEDVLSLSATRKVVDGEAGQTVAYARSFTLPCAVQADRITAELKDGVLRLTLPKAEAVKPRKITIS